jgi:hypothetical protein
MKVRLRRIEIKEEKREPVLTLEVKTSGWEFGEDGSLPLLFNYTNIYMLPLTNIFSIPPFSYFIYIKFLGLYVYNI